MDAYEQSLRDADRLIATLNGAIGVDYTPVRAELAEQIFFNGHWEGNWDVTTDLPLGFRNLRSIQEDQYDQHMDDDEDKPDWDKLIHTNPVYVWFADET